MISAISGSGTLVQQGPGLLALAGSNTFTGLTTISGGTLQIGDGNVTDIVGQRVEQHGDGLQSLRQFDLRRADQRSRRGRTGRGKIVLTGSNSYTGGTTISAGTLQVGNGGTSGSIVGDVVNQGNLGFQSQR